MVALAIGLSVCAGRPPSHRHFLLRCRSLKQQQRQTRIANVRDGQAAERRSALPRLAQCGAAAGPALVGTQESYNMFHTVRHDAIVLNAGVDAEAFERFMTNELLPHFAERFKGPTRVSKADLKAQSLLRDAKSARKFLLVTVWHGAAALVAGAAFENARTNRLSQTDALLKKLDGFARRSAEKVFAELISTEVPTIA